MAAYLAPARELLRVGSCAVSGADGASAYEVAVKNGFSGTEAEWLVSLKGAPGDPGAQGQPGMGAYELACEKGYSGTEEEWLESLKASNPVTSVCGRTGRVILVANDVQYQAQVGEEQLNGLGNILDEIVMTLNQMINVAEVGA